MIRQHPHLLLFVVLPRSPIINNQFRLLTIPYPSPCLVLSPCAKSEQVLMSATAWVRMLKFSFDAYHANMYKQRVRALPAAFNKSRLDVKYLFARPNTSFSSGE